MQNRRQWRFYIGKNSWAAQAERKVQQILEELPMDHFIVVNDVRFRYGNIDHLVIRDDGVIFLIETKSHRGTVSFDGKRLLINGRPFKRNPICQINRNIRWLRRMAIKLGGMDRWYAAILVFPEGIVQSPRSFKRVNIMGYGDLVDFISTYPGEKPN